MDFSAQDVQREPFDLPTLNNIVARARRDPEDPISRLFIGSLLIQTKFLFIVRSKGQTPWNTTQNGHGLLLQRVSCSPATYYGFHQQDKLARSFMEQFDILPSAP